MKSKITLLATFIVLAGCKKTLTLEVTVEGGTKPFTIECLAAKDYIKMANTLGQFKPETVAQQVTAVNTKSQVTFKLEKQPTVCGIGPGTIKFHADGKDGEVFQLTGDGSFSFRYNSFSRTFYRVDDPPAKGIRVLDQAEVKALAESVLKN